MKPDIDRARAYVQALELPPQGPRFESARDLSGAPIDFGTSPQALVIGSQMAEFSAAVAPAARRAVADSLLIAQLAANKAADSASDVMAWYRKYVKVLQNLGWLVSGIEFRDQQVSDSDAGLHTAIIPIVTSMLAPGSAALTLVLAVLNGLKEMDRQSKWLTIFDRTSQHAHGARFQFGSVDADPDGVTRITALCFGLLAQRTTTQVLFFRFSSDQAALKSANASLSMTPQQLSAASDAIAARVRPFVSDYVASLDI